jgi:hypothetical protein
MDGLVAEQSLKRRRGDGQVALLAGYSLLAFAATGRSVYELVVKFDEAPLAYTLSTVAAIVYLVAVWAIARGDATSLKVARIACTFELVGVMTVGTLTAIDPDVFDVRTVWTLYGIDYGFLPLVMPALALWWIARREDPQRSVR